jgi:hypothetical protein
MFPASSLVVAVSKKQAKDFAMLIKSPNIALAAQLT